LAASVRELLSPDLRCFWDKCEVQGEFEQEYGRTMDFSNLAASKKVIKGADGKSIVGSVGGDERAIDGLHGQFDAAVSAQLALHAGDVGFDGALLNSQLGGDFAVGASQHDEFENLQLAIGELGPSTGRAGLRHAQEPVNETG
jgi:hypothetical protein